VKGFPSGLPATVRAAAEEITTMFEPHQETGRSCCTRKNGLRTFVAKRCQNPLSCNPRCVPLADPSVEHKHIQSIPTIESACLASSAAPFGVPRSAEIAFALPPFVWISETRDSASPAQSGRSEPTHVYPSQQAPTQCSSNSTGSPRHQCSFLR